MAEGLIEELHGNCGNWTKPRIVEEIVRLERKIFPKHESLATFFNEELKKKNSGLLYLQIDGELVGYVMYSWPSSLYASITKLAGEPKDFSLFRYLFLRKFLDFTSYTQMIVALVKKRITGF